MQSTGIPQGSASTLLCNVYFGHMENTLTAAGQLPLVQRTWHRNWILVGVLCFLLFLLRSLIRCSNSSACQI